MTAQNQRDPDGTDILGQVRDGLADLKANVISRWGRVPYVAADPTSLVDGMVWTRSDNEALSWRANSATMTAAAGRMAGVTYAVNQAGIGAADTGITGLGLTFTALAGRRYELQYTFGVTQVTANGAQTFQWSLAGVAQNIIDIEDAIIGTRMVSGFWELGVMGAGVKSVGLLGRVNAGTMTIPNSTLVNGRIAVFDVGV